MNLTIRRGSFTVVTGRNGSGKTTLLRVLLGLLPKDQGEITWNGTVVHDPGSFFVPPRAAYTGQIPRLFSDTLRDNILMGLPADDDRLTRAIRSAVMEADLANLEEIRTIWYGTGSEQQDASTAPAKAPTSQSFSSRISALEAGTA